MIKKKWYSDIQSSQVKAAALREGVLNLALARVADAIGDFSGDLEQLQTQTFLNSIDELRAEVEYLVQAIEPVSDLDAWFLAHDLLTLRMHLVMAYFCRQVIDAAMKREALEVLANPSRYTAFSTLEFSVLASWVADHGDLTLISLLPNIHKKLAAAVARETRPLIRGVALASGDRDGYRQKSAVTLADGDRSFEEFVSGKSIAIVGPVNTGVNNGEEIDSFDVVIRFNHHDKAQYQSNTFGKRSDISYYTDPAFRKVVIGTKSSLSGLAFAVPQKADVVSSQLGVLKLEAKIRSAYRQSNSVFFKSHGNALQRMLFDLLRFDVGAVKAFNMDMWLSSHDRNYRARRSKLDPHMFIHHDLISNFRFTKRLVANGVITVDRTLAQILLVKEFDYIVRLELLHGETFRDSQTSSGL
ncbi:hypothetical protein ASG25_01900 [Rhizobium sp. Leaf384]|uniref:hypothetical protein n=1 Tax=unclassified Rhizobium TaxID=2613769 RepID=UPI000713E81B|nr:MULTISPECIES: hypothetical protein [unclassified Rhizobium]KQS74192.1 hypothetical protein ASG58_16965 [Rhizobium sp. Leaf383]KQS80387.1 hypothetical protein ASG25_01900 [Rhizobium sp. Leaf384]